MKFIDNIKNKLFPDDTEVLYYDNTDKKDDKNRFSNSNTKHEENVISYKPVSFSVAEEIGNTLKSGNIVLVDIELLDKKEAYRILDFLGGIAFALDGDMKRLSKNLFEFNLKK